MLGSALLQLPGRLPFPLHLEACSSNTRHVLLCQTPTPVLNCMSTLVSLVWCFAACLSQRRSVETLPLGCTCNSV